MSPELETLDQLLSGELPLTLIRRVYPNDEAFLHGVLGLLEAGDVCLLAADKTDVARWRWRELFLEGAVMQELNDLQLQVTGQGIRRIA